MYKRTPNNFPILGLQVAHVGLSLSIKTENVAYSGNMLVILVEQSTDLLLISTDLYLIPGGGTPGSGYGVTLLAWLLCINRCG